MKISPNLFDANSIFLLDLLFKKELNLSRFTCESKQLNKCEKRLKSCNFITGSRVSCSRGNIGSIGGGIGSFGSLEITDSGRDYLEECKKLPFNKINIPYYDILGILKNSFSKILASSEAFSREPHSLDPYNYIYLMSTATTKYYKYMDILTEENSLTTKGLAIVKRDILNIIKYKYVYKPEAKFYSLFYKYCASFLPREDIAILISSGSHNYLELFD